MAVVNIQKKHKFKFIVGDEHFFSNILYSLTDISIYYIFSHIILNCELS
jgi:hypothetical protein